MPKIGILFDIEELGSGLYGYAAYKTFFEAIDSRQLTECWLRDGDTMASGQFNHYCIAIDAPYASTIAIVKNAMSQSTARGLLPLASRFLDDALVSREHLVFAGRIDFSGNLVGCQTSWVFEAWQKSQAKHRTQNPKPIPASSMLTRNLQEQEIVRETKAHVSSVQWQIGDVIENRWEVKDILQGGLGIVYIVYDREFENAFAAKTFQNEIFSRNPQVAERFVQEATTWINLDLHQNVTQAKSVEIIGGKPFLFLEYITGGDLSGWIGTPRLTKDFPQVLHFGIQFCDGITHALSKGIKVHRDIKPQNCLITEDHILKVTDFGLARALDDVVSEEWKQENSKVERKKQIELLSKLLRKLRRFSKDVQPSDTQAHPSRFTRTGVALGTYTHMAPEQFDDAKHVDIRADIYSFGIMLYQMLTGSLPFAGIDQQEFEYHHKISPPPKLPLQSNVSETVISHLNSIVQTCLAKDPHQRFDTFDTLRQPLADIYKALTGEVVRIPTTRLELEVGQWNDKGLGLIRLGKLKEGLICLDRALDLDPEYIGAWNNKGLVFVKLEKYEDAVRCFEQAIKIVPHYAHAWSNKGVALMRLGQPNEALVCLEKALEISPRYAIALSNKGATLNMLKRTKDAIGSYTLAIYYNPHLAIAWFGKGLALAQVGHNQDALSHFEQALRLGYQDPNMAQIIKEVQQR